MCVRVLYDVSASGAWNMAVDEALMVAAGETGQATLRFYYWEEATLSLGYFQQHADRHSHAASQNAPLVRRATGGGAILHDRELTYSFVAPIADRLSADVESLYYAFHETLVETLADWQVPAFLCAETRNAPHAHEPFLCFQRRAKGDVLLGADKIAGSAQRRHYGAVLQHGSILLQRSPQAPELPGIGDLTGQAITSNELVAAWQSRLLARLGLSAETAEFPTQEAELARQFMRHKYAASEWTHRR